MPEQKSQSAASSIRAAVVSWSSRAERSNSRRRASTNALAQRAHVGADARRVHAVVAAALSTGGAHVDAASRSVADDPDDDIVGEAEPAGLLARLDTAGIGVRRDDGPAGHRFCDLERL